MDFVRKAILTKIVQRKNVLSMSVVINMSKNMSDFKENLSVFSKENIKKLTMGRMQMNIGSNIENA